MTSQLNFEMILFQGDHFRHPFERPQQVVETGERVGGKVEAAPESSGTNIIKLFFVIISTRRQHCFDLV